jgi:hypothetical protein
VQSDSSVQLEFRQCPLEQISPDVQSEFTVHVLSHVASGVGVGVFVGVFVGVLTGVPVGEFVGVPTKLNVSVHAGSEAFGVSWGTFGATGVVFVSC